MTIGEKIKTLRKERGWTQKALALISGIAEITIRNYEAGKYKPKLDKLEMLSKAFSITVTELLINVEGYDFQDYDIRLTFDMFAKSEHSEAASKMLQQLRENEKQGYTYVYVSFKDKAALDHFRPLSQENKEKALDYMDYLKERQDKE